MLIGALVASLSFGAVAQAADLGGDYRRGSIKDDPLPVYNPRFNWTGAYAGLQLGYAWADTDARSGPLAGFNQSYGYDGDGFIGGGHIGYNIQAGTLVYGIEADIDFADLDYGGLGTLNFGHQTEIEYMGSIRARFGFAADRTLFYVTGGYAFGEVDITKRNAAGVRFASYGDTRHGWTIGGGLEQAFTNNITARLEYRYTDLGDIDFRSVPVNSIDNSEVEVQSIRAGVSIKF